MIAVHGCRLGTVHTACAEFSQRRCAQVAYDKLETKNVFSKRFGQCRDGEIRLDVDDTLLIMKESDAAQYQVS